MKYTHHLSRKLLILIAAVVCILATGISLTACDSASVETQNTQPSTAPVSEAYQKLLTIEGAERYDPAALDALARWIDKEGGFIDRYPDKWKLEQFGSLFRLTCYSALRDDHTRVICSLVYDGKNVFSNATARQTYTDVPEALITGRVFAAKNSRDISDDLKSAFVEFIMDSCWFPSKDLWNQCQSEWYFETAPLPGAQVQTEYLTLLIKYWDNDSLPGNLGTQHSLYYDGTSVQYWREEYFVLTTEVPKPTEPEPTEPPKTFVKEESPAYQKLLTLDNAEDFLCNRFGYNELAIFAEWIDAQEGLMETYPEWYVVKYADGGAGFFCHTLPEEDNSCDYMIMYMYDFHSLYRSPSTGRRYFTDVPREEIAELIYGAYDPLGVDNALKERMIDQALISECFAWNVMDPEFRITDSYYEIRRYWPYPEYEPDNYTDSIYLVFHVWRPGMAEDEYIKCWLSYDEELKRIDFGLDGPMEYWLSGAIS